MFLHAGRRYLLGWASWLEEAFDQAHAEDSCGSCRTGGHDRGSASIDKKDYFYSFDLLWLWMMSRQVYADAQPAEWRLIEGNTALMQFHYAPHNR